MICYACVCVSECMCVCVRLSICLLTGKRMTSVCACLPGCQSCQSPFERVLRVANGKGETSVSRSRDRPVSLHGNPPPLYPSTSVPVPLSPLPSSLFPASQSRVTSHQSRTTKHFKCHLVHLTHTHTPLSCKCVHVCACVCFGWHLPEPWAVKLHNFPLSLCVCACVCVNEVTWLLESTTEWDSALILPTNPLPPAPPATALPTSFF